MSVLEQVLNYKRQKDAEAQADIQAIPQAIAQFTQARQQAQKSALDALLAQSTLQKNESDILKNQRESALLEKFSSGGMSNGNILIPEATIGGFKLVNTDQSKQVEEQSRKYTDSETKAMSSAEALITDLRDLRGLVEKDKEEYTKDQTPFTKSQFLGSSAFDLLGGVGKKGQAFNLMKKNVSERLLRLRSGAQINESEYDRFQKMLPTIFRDDELDLEQLDKFESEFSNIMGRVQSGAKWDAKSKQFVDRSKSSEQITSKNETSPKTETFVINGVTYNIPIEAVEEFKKDKGIK